MKIRTKLALSAVLVLMTLMLFSCHEDTVSISYDGDGNYTGFSDISPDYTAAKAAADDCLVIDTIQGTNEYGVSVTENQETAGYEHWQNFLEKAESGQDAFLRVAHFIDGIGYYHDLYYDCGWYTIFDLNEYGVSEGASYRYLRRLDGYVGVGSDRKEACFYVLTDSLSLTYKEVNQSFFSSDLSTVTKIPFRWLGFMIYFED